MKIRVMYHDGNTEMVRRQLLPHLIDTGKIQKFHRSDGWVTLGVDPVRERRRSVSHGKERRDDTGS